VPVWVEAEIVLEAHQQVIDRHGGVAGFDADLLDGALNRPRMAYHYEDPKPGIVDLAAVYFIAIAEAHAFVEGNKRTAAAVCELFLMLNGMEFDPPDEEAVEVFVKAGHHRATGFGRRELAGWIGRQVRVMR
jgi:death-on-curing protein